jgi:O-antigen/teichoic acid export membrane protein
MRFAPQVIVDIISSILVTLLAWPIAAWLRDYAAMLWLLLLQAAIQAIGSHIVAERGYKWTWDRDYARRFITFGWPLLINGLLMYGILQGDRFVIGASGRLFSNSVYNLVDLGIYSVAFAVTMAPSTLFTSMASSLFLPVLSSVQTEREEFERRYKACILILAFAAALIAIPFIVVGRWIVPFIYGPKYAAAGVFIGWLGAMWGVRVFRTAPTQAALALGDSRNSMIANIARSSALIGVLISAATGRSLTSIAICGLFGEVVATVVCLWRLSVKHHVPARLSLMPITICSTAIVAALIVQLGTFGWMISTLIGVVTLGTCAVTMLLCVGREHGWHWLFGQS